ncbi:MAG: hypothetical protein U0414_03900 [Polyangiaceae bacterium]
MRCSLALAFVLARCSSGPPPYAEAPAASEVTSASATPPIAAVAAPSEEPPLDALSLLPMSGPEPELDRICGPGCVLGDRVPRLAGVDEAALALGEDPRDPQPASVKTTWLVMKVAGLFRGWALFREGDGFEHLEIFAKAPPSRASGRRRFDGTDVNDGAPVRVARPVRFGGGAPGDTSRSGTPIPARLLEDATTGERALAVDVWRADPVTTNVLVLCAVGADGPSCAELVTAEELPVVERTLERGVVRITTKDGATNTYRAFVDR